MSQKIERYLVVNARGAVRMTQRWPNLKWDEVAFPVRITIPDTWGKVYSSLAIDVTLPVDAAPEARLMDQQVILPDEDDED